MLFIVQSELIESKVEMAMNKAISQVVEQIMALRLEMHQEISKVNERLIALETALGKRNKVRHEIRTRFVDYAFKAGWLILGVVLTYAVSYSKFLY